jgi:hypothetical protein
MELTIHSFGTIGRTGIISAKEKTGSAGFLGTQ